MTPTGSLGSGLCGSLFLHMIEIRWVVKVMMI